MHLFIVIRKKVIEISTSHCQRLKQPSFAYCLSFYRGFGCFLSAQAANSRVEQIKYTYIAAL